MRASRLLALLITLQVQGRVSARALAERFEVSKRTIYRDVDELSAAGVPVYAEHGVHGGFQLASGWTSQLTGMTPDEIEASLFAALPGPAAELGMTVTATTARLKLMAAGSPAAGGESLRISGRFHFDATPWHRRAAAPAHELRAVAQAVWENRRLEIRYESWAKTTTRIVEPVGLVLKAGAWYFVCLRNGRAAIFKVANVREATLLTERFRRPASFDLALAWTESVASFESALKRGRATLRIQPQALPRVDLLDTAMAEPILAAAPDSEGVRVAVVPIETIAHAATSLFGFGSEIEVLEPVELRIELARRAALLHSLYAIDLAQCVQPQFCGSIE
jgi:predicted DNA-binding transcriptional regulator YafY